MKSAFGRAPLPPPGTTTLRVAVAWGTTVLATRELLPGQSACFGDGPDGLIPLPDGLNVAPVPVRAVDAGWQVDPRGVTDGIILLGGREQDPTRLIPPLVVTPGDWGLLQYGTVSLYFQFDEIVAPIPVDRKWRYDRATTWSIAAAALLHVATLVVLALTAAPRAVRPVELSDEGQIAARFGLNRWLVMAPPPPEEAVAVPPSEQDRSIDFRVLAEPVRRALSEIRSLNPTPRDSTPILAPILAPILPTLAAKSLALVPASGAVWGGLRKEAVDQVVASELTLLQTCCDAEVVPIAEFRGSMQVSLTVAADGTIQGADVSATPRRPKLEACVLSQVKQTWRFPKGSAPSNVKVALRLGVESTP